MKAYTDITVLVDRSGSMASMKQQMESAYQEFIQKHRAVPSTRISLIQFDGDDDQDVQYTALPVEKAENLILKPRGMTPLLDAFCKAIDRTGRRLAEMNEQDRPDQVLFVVITDGAENASKQFTRHDVFDRVGRQRREFKWQFLYLGANQDAIAEAATFNIPRGHALHYRNISPMFVGEDAPFAANTMQYVNRATKTVADFTDEDRKKADSVA